MNNDLYRLVYVSRNRIGGEPGTLAREIGTILETARTLNVEAGVSGALMYNGGCFAQVLEGPHDALQETFERIQCDERHGDVQLLGLDRVDERGFDGWSMAYVGQDESSRAAFARLAPDGALDPATMPPERVFALLREHLADAEPGAKAA